MFFEINLSLFPIVLIKFKNQEINDRDFDFFLRSWENIYSYKKNFALIFDMIDMPIYSLRYSFKMASFIKKIRGFSIQYLKKSIMIIDNDKILQMLKFIFYLQPPVADIYITKENVENILHHIENDNNIYELKSVEKMKVNNIKIETHIKPDRPFLPFL